MVTLLRLEKTLVSDFKEAFLVHVFPYFLTHCYCEGPVFLSERAQFDYGSIKAMLKNLMHRDTHAHTCTYLGTYTNDRLDHVEGATLELYHNPTGTYYIGP